MRHLIRSIVATAVIAGMSSVAASDDEKGIVVTSEGLSERCILTLVVTSVDGKEVDADATGTYELEPGSHTFAGYGGEDPSLCDNFSGDDGIMVAEGDMIGKGSLTLNVAAGKEYYLGVDVRSRDKSKWQIVAWKIKH